MVPRAALGRERWRQGTLSLDYDIVPSRFSGRMPEPKSLAALLCGRRDGDLVMRKLIILGLMAAIAVPTAAPAQSGREIRRDQRELREEQRELRDARRYGDRDDVRDERRDVREARRELRQDLRDWDRNNWRRSYRDRHRSEFRRGSWRSPYRYRTFRPGIRIAAGYYSPRFIINDPWRYNLPRVARHLRWVRFYDDLLLVDVRRGYVVDVIRNVYW
jgi:Ni/Co efflux regulator RcnB